LVPEKRSKVNNGFGSKGPFAELSWRALISVPCHRISYTVGDRFCGWAALAASSREIRCRCTGGAPLARSQNLISSDGPALRRNIVRIVRAFDDGRKGGHFQRYRVPLAFGGRCQNV
jgi:hypothetical protein